MFQKIRNLTRSRPRIKPLIFLSLFSLSILSVLYVFSEENRSFVNKNASNFHEIPALISDKQPPIITPKNPFFSLQPFQTPKILFIVADETLPDPFLDQPFFDFLTSNLSCNVTYHNANNSYDYSSFDAIIISDSISGSADVASLENASIPILTMEQETWSVFNLGNGEGVSTADNKLIEVLDNSSYITNYLPLGPLNISIDPNADKGYLTGFNAVPSGSNVTSLIRPTYNFPSEKFYRSLVVLDKEGVDWSGVQRATERRAFLGFSNGSSLNQEGWKLWNKTIKWTLYDDYSGNARITVNVEDLNNKAISNASVTLLNSSMSISQYTNNTGNTTFNDISWGLYNIIAEYNTVINDSLTNINIIPARTYYPTAEFTFKVQLSFYTDITPPQFNNTYFDKDLSQGTFYVDVFDENLVNSSVTLNVTATNLTSGLEIIKDNFTMIFQAGNTFYNDTALDTLTDETNISINYNIIAEDTAGNINKTQIISFLLSDPDPPIIHELNVTDYGDGTLEFYANITDTSKINDPVLLMVNGTLVHMHLNASGFWTYLTQSLYGNLLNYTIFSVNDSVGNENGSKIPGFPMDIGEITVSDSTPPQIFWITPYASHDKGFVEWNVRINETTNFQSGLDNSVKITISVNSGPNDTQPMIILGDGYFYYFDIFSFNDMIEFWINASDLVGNFKIEHAIFEIFDIALPQVTFSAIEFGNGTVEFSATVVDWPSNITTVFAYENSTGFWEKYDLSQVNINLYVGRYHNFLYKNRELFYYVEAKDEAGNNNTLIQIKYLLLTDVISPVINLKIENSTVIDGQITLRAFAIDSWGSSQYVTNPFFVNITHQGITETYPMEQEPILLYYFSTHNFTFGDYLTIKVWTNDDAGNLGIISKSITVSDDSPPKILDYGVFEYQNGTISIWAEVNESSSGSGLFINNTSVKLEYIFFNEFNEEIMVIKEDDTYWYTISGFEPGNAFTYRITVIDNNGNDNDTGWKAVSILDKTPPTCYDDDFGYQEVRLNYSSSQLIFWANATDTFGSIQGVNITISYLSNSDRINETHLMPYNGSVYAYSAILRFNTSFSYSIHIFDSNITNTVIKSEEDLKTYNGPIVYQADLVWLTENKVFVWANVSDWGTPTVYFEYEFVTGGAGSSKKELLANMAVMTFNGSLYTVEVTFSEQGALQWRVIAQDAENALEWQSSWEESSFEPEASLTLDDLILPFTLVALVPILLIVTALIVRRKYQQLMHEKREITRHYNEKLSFVSNIYSILVTTDVGIPIYSVSNVLYQADESLNIEFSGLSVGMSDFLENFQSQILETYQPEGTKDVTELIRMSVIEQHKIQILIVASPSIRTFVFMMKKPTEFIREIFLKVVKDLETQLQLPDVGIVDESLVEPQTEQILNKTIPLSLFRTISIDPIQLRHIDQQLKSGTRHFPISQAALNALKRLYIFQTKPEIMRGDALSEIALFDKISEEETEYTFGGLLYGDILRILTKILKIPVSVTFEALWVGSSPLLSIIKSVDI
ncbi:MAG: hypothetical protein ACFE8U_04425 [Candidatus Hermodarchaeota archaeon]